MSRKQKHAHHEEEAGEAWLLPYSDLMTLLLAVFIVLFAVSQVDEQKAAAMSDEFTEQMMNGEYIAAKMSSPAAVVTSPGAASSESGEMKGMTEQEQMEQVKMELDKKLKEQGLDSSVSTGIDKRGLVITLSNAIFFDPGSAEIKPDNEYALIEIANMVKVMDNYIRIEGHTDNVPMNSPLYRSNWDLSAARAANVVRLLTTKTDVAPERLIAVGYGEYRPVSGNDTEEGRAKNRRIDIIVLSSEYDALEQ